NDRAAKPISVRAGQLLPAALAPPRRASMILGPLMCGNDPFGFVLFEMGPDRGMVYDALDELVSGALRSVQLVREMLDERVRREQAERARMESELRIAQRIQAGLLPKNPRVAGLQIATAMEPATEVAGDYYDIRPFAGGAWLAIGDVSGHGIPAGIVM